MPATKSLVIILSSAVYFAPTLRAEETTNKGKVLEIKTEDEKVKKQTFCSKTNGDEAEKKCQSWLNSQKTQLGSRLLSGSCTSGEMTSDSNCFYRSEGEISYILQKTGSVYEIK